MVRDERALLVFAERQREAFEQLRSPVPRESVLEPLDSRLELRLESAPHKRIGPICANDEVGGAKLVERRDMTRKVDSDPTFLAEVMEELVERKALDRGKA